MGIFGGLMFVFKEIKQRAEDELYDESGTRQELVVLHKAIEAGEMSEDEFERREDELLTRLAEIVARKARGGGDGPGDP